MKEKGEQTVGVKLWFDWTVNRLKNTETDHYLGEFTKDDMILVITKRGTYYLAPPDLNHHFPEDIKVIEKFAPEKVYNVIYYNGEQKAFYLKRFVFEPVSSETSFISNADSYLVDLTPGEKLLITIQYRKDKKVKEQVIDAQEFLKVKSIAARGKKLTDGELLKVKFAHFQQERQDTNEPKTLFDQNVEDEN
jgi:topoisomerase-4 subunit A